MLLAAAQVLLLTHPLLSLSIVEHWMNDTLSSA